MHGQRQPVETDLTRTEGEPSPAADQAWARQKSDLQVTDLQLKVPFFKATAMLTGPAGSPVNKALAAIFGAVPGVGLGWFADYAGAPYEVSIPVAAVAWLGTTALLFRRK